MAGEGEIQNISRREVENLCTLGLCKLQVCQKITGIKEGYQGMCKRRKIEGKSHF